MLRAGRLGFPAATCCFVGPFAPRIFPRGVFISEKLGFFPCRKTLAKLEVYRYKACSAVFLFRIGFAHGRKNAPFRLGRHGAARRRLRGEEDRSLETFFF